LLETASNGDKQIMILFTLTPAAYNSYEKLNFDKLSGDMKTLLAKVQASLNK
jgi:hypothetical protein